MVYGGMPDDLRHSLTHCVMIDRIRQFGQIADALVQIDRQDKISGILPGMNSIVTSSALAAEKTGFLSMNSKTALICEKRT